MNEKRTIESVINQARGRIIKLASEADEAGNIRLKIDYQNRRAILDGLLRDLHDQRSGHEPSKSVFISYSTNSGSFYFKSLQEKLKTSGFNVFTGFEKELGDKGNLLGRILRQLRRSTVYLGLLTKEMRVIGPRDNYQWSPGVWTVEEKGMAVALGKPFSLLVEEGIHDDYWRNTAPGKVHTMFNKDNFKEKADEIAETINDRYHEAIMEFYNPGDLLKSNDA